MATILKALIMKATPQLFAKKLHTHMSNTLHSWDYDVIICGGGVVGSALAAKLQQESQGNIKVCVLEQLTPQTLEKCTASEIPDIRVYALAPKSIGLLQKLDSWKYVKDRSQPYDHMQVWENSGPGFLRFSGRDFGADELGRIAEDRLIQASLFASIENSPFSDSVETIFGASVTALSIEKLAMNAVGPATLSYKIKSKDGTADEIKTITGRLVVAADGAQSTVRRLAGLPTWGWSYGQEAVVATVEVSKAHSTAWQRYLPGGPLALLPLWGKYSSIVWSTAAHEARRLTSLSDEAFLEELNEALQSAHRPAASSSSSRSSGSSGSGQSRLVEDISEALKAPLRLLRKEIVALAKTVASAAALSAPFKQPPIVEGIRSRRVTFPLQLQQASAYTSARLALVGDAAHSIHPQAGQGLNLGLADADALGDTLLGAVAVGADIGSAEVLDGYGAQAYRRNLAMIGAIDCVDKLFSIGSRSAPGPGAPSPAQSPLLEGVARLRTLGLLGIHGSGFVKNSLAKYAMGLQQR